MMQPYRPTFPSDKSTSWSLESNWKRGLTYTQHGGWHNLEKRDRLRQTQASWTPNEEDMQKGSRVTRLSHRSLESEESCEWWRRRRPTGRWANPSHKYLHWEQTGAISDVWLCFCQTDYKRKHRVKESAAVIQRLCVKFSVADYDSKWEKRMWRIPFIC